MSRKQTDYQYEDRFPSDSHITVPFSRNSDRLAALLDPPRFPAALDQAETQSEFDFAVSELRWMTAEVIEALNREVGEGTVTRLNVRVGRGPK